MVTTLVFSPSDMPMLLGRISPNITSARAQLYGDPILRTALKYQINTPLRLSHFLAQMLHESGLLKYTEEVASGAAYEGRKDLGNIYTGDGRRFKGRGLIQLTGRANYARYGRFLKDTSLINEPERVASLPLAVDSAGWFWAHGQTTPINNAADKDNVFAVTRMINGGTNGLDKRKTLLRAARKAVDYLSALLVQRRINASGAYPKLLEDGDYGPQTMSVVRELQADFFLKITGQTDQKTWNAMQQMAASRPSQPRQTDTTGGFGYV
jgi:predicted chitinase